MLVFAAPNRLKQHNLKRSQRPMLCITEQKKSGLCTLRDSVSADKKLLLHEDDGQERRNVLS
jgi:hypothetical protein